MDVPINSEVLRQRREARGWTMRDLARVSGTDHSVISRLERNLQSDVGVNTLLALARALELPAEDFLPEWSWRVPLHVPPNLVPELAAMVTSLATLPDESQRTITRILHAYLAGIPIQKGEE